MAQSVIFIDNDNLIELIGLKDIALDAFVNDATVQITLTDTAGDEVAGQSWPVTLNYVAASDGNYRATLEDGLVLTPGRKYTAVVTADAGSDLLGKWTVKPVAKIRADV